MDSVIAVDVGGTFMKGGLVARDGTILHHERWPTPRSEGPDRVIAAISGFVDHLGTLARPVAVGLAVPGLVSGDTAVYSAAFGWRDVPAAAFTAVGLPVALGHDVRSAGEAELAYGWSGENVLFLPIGTGIAGAVVLNGTLYGGAKGWAGQIGHIPVWPDGLPCSCGQLGCLGAYASASAIARRAGETSAAEVARRTDPFAVQVWGEAVEALAVALATYVLVADPSMIVIGGGLAQAADALVVPLRERLAARLAFREPPPVEVSALGVEAGMLGAALLAWRLDL
ncbi:ROK family protein [Nonomuraea sp. NPDC050556]|uniref:ROK family protein n=1 Tax=Nonomuraea sp. NPDC050556 TaxID=3364369 RepID=UPI0037AB507D